MGKAVLPLSAPLANISSAGSRSGESTGRQSSATPARESSVGLPILDRFGSYYSPHSPSGYTKKQSYFLCVPKDYFYAKKLKALINIVGMAEVILQGNGIYAFTHNDRGVDIYEMVHQ